MRPQTANFDLALSLAPYTQIKYIPACRGLANIQAQSSTFTYNSHDAKSSQEANALPNTKVHKHGSREEHGAKSEQRAAEIVAGEERGSVLRVGHGNVC